MRPYVPPPPVKPASRRPVVPPPPRKEGTQILYSGAEQRADAGTAAWTATPHQQRVTLNLLLHAACCPPELRPVLTRLADGGWDLAALDPDALEHIFATVGGTADLAERALAEFEADTRSIVDYRTSDGICPLCGHQHIRWEFTLVNKAGGWPVKCGSTCIIEYGINVDGKGTGEEALKALNAAINRMKKIADREGWQAEHPDHVDTMRYVEEVARWCRARPFNKHYREMNPPGFQRHCHALVKQCNGVLRYYREEKFLTPLQTVRVWGGNEPGRTKDDPPFWEAGILNRFAELVTDYNEARAEVEATYRARGWLQFISTQPTTVPAPLGTGGAQ